MFYLRCLTLNVRKCIIYACRLLDFVITKKIYKKVSSLTREIKKIPFEFLLCVCSDCVISDSFVYTNQFRACDLLEKILRSLDFGVLLIMTYQNERIITLYGSQTGNSQDLAERVWRESKRYFFTGPVMCMDSYNILELVDEKCVIFICSTTGQGEEPDNMKNFWKFLLRKNLARDCLSNLRLGKLIDLVMYRV